MADRHANWTAKKTTNHIKKGGRRYSRQKAREEKERKKRKFQVFSVNENDKAFLSRVALVHWGESKEPLRYMFHHLTLAELKGFWWSTYAERERLLLSPSVIVTIDYLDVRVVKLYQRTFPTWIKSLIVVTTN